MDFNSVKGKVAIVTGAEFRGFSRKMSGCDRVASPAEVDTSVSWCGRAVLHSGERPERHRAHDHSP